LGCVRMVRYSGRIPALVHGTTTHLLDIKSSFRSLFTFAIHTRFRPHLSRLRTVV
uniref:Uncharacterized protein n=1 Tax=Anisakis simplex TaxID=6269 RepID=A0A0M3JRL0_ANISI